MNTNKMRLAMDNTLIKTSAGAKERAKLLGKLSRTAKEKWQYAKRVLSLSSQVDKLSTEVELLTTYATDTIYRLRYENMAYDYISPAIERLLGYSLAEISAMDFRSLIVETRIVEDNMPAVKDYHIYEDKRRRGETQCWQADYLMTKKDGTRIWVSDVSYPWYDAEGNVIGSTGCLRDITDRIRVESRIKKELMRLLHVDPLTNLANRREFFQRANNELKRQQRSRTDLSVLLLDIDHFKKVNDHFGDAVGDKVLVEMAEVIKTCLRETDLAARLSGEEFAILLPDTDQQGAYFVADRICKTIANHAFLAYENRDKPIHCTVSIGVASAMPTEEKTTTDLYKLADTRLYIAKNTGRNQVSMDEVMQMH